MASPLRDRRNVQHGWYREWRQRCSSTGTAHCTRRLMGSLRMRRSTGRDPLLCDVAGRITACKQRMSLGWTLGVWRGANTLGTPRICTISTISWVRITRRSHTGLHRPCAYEEPPTVCYINYSPTRGRQHSPPAAARSDCVFGLHGLQAISPASSQSSWRTLQTTVLTGSRSETAWRLRG